MQFIIGDKLFDTEKAELIVSYERKLFYAGVPRKINLYKTAKNRWFEVDTTYKSCTEMTEKNVKYILSKLNLISDYEKCFGKLEEA